MATRELIPAPLCLISTVLLASGVPYKTHSTSTIQTALGMKLGFRTAVFRPHKHSVQRRALIPPQASNGGGNPEAGGEEVGEGAREGMPLRVLSVDLGTKRTGFALGYAGMAYETLPAANLPGISTVDLQALAHRTLTIAREERVSGVVVGIPVGSQSRVDNWRRDTAQGSRCRRFAETLASLAHQSALPMKIYAVDESGTSRRARTALGVAQDKRVARSGAHGVDSEAARLIAEFFFENPSMALEIKAGEGPRFGRSSGFTGDRSNPRGPGTSSRYKRKWTK